MALYSSSSSGSYSPRGQSAKPHDGEFVSRQLQGQERRAYQNGESFTARNNDSHIIQLSVIQQDQVAHSGYNHQRPQADRFARDSYPQTIDLPRFNRPVVHKLGQARGAIPGLDLNHFTADMNHLNYLPDNNFRAPAVGPADSSVRHQMYRPSHATATMYAPTMSSGTYPTTAPTTVTRLSQSTNSEGSASERIADRQTEHTSAWTHNTSMNGSFSSSHSYYGNSDGSDHMAFHNDDHLRREGP